MDTNNDLKVSSGTATAKLSLETVVDLAKRAFALKKYEDAVDHYATALELATIRWNEDAPEIADLYLAYGKSLLENAVVQSTVLGKENPDEREDDDDEPGSSTKHGPILSFSGDAEDAEDDPAVDLFADATRNADGDAEEAEEEEDVDNGEPEDDFNAAWEVLDLARAIYEKQAASSEDEEVELKLADTFITLGDISLETEKFDQAIADYEAGLALKSKILPKSSRQIAEAHYKLSIVLDLTSGRLAGAIDHVRLALESIEFRLKDLTMASPNALEQPPIPSEDKVNVKGKGKGKDGRLIRIDDVSTMKKSQIDTEIKDLEGLKADLALKIEELKTAPNDVLGDSALAIVAKALDKELNSATGSSSAQVNDLTSIVKKKKKPVEIVSASPTKRKAGDAEGSSTSEKRPKVGSPPA